MELSTCCIPLFCFCCGETPGLIDYCPSNTDFLADFETRTSPVFPTEVLKCDRVICYTTQPGPIHKSGTPADENGI